MTTKRKLAIGLASLIGLFGIAATQASATPTVDTYSEWGPNSGGLVSGGGSNYSTARSGSGITANVDPGTFIVGQSVSKVAGTHYWVNIGYLDFPVSVSYGLSEPAILHLHVGSVTVDQPFTLEIWNRNYGSSLTTADWLPDPSSGNTMLGSITSDNLVANSTNDIQLDPFTQYPNARFELVLKETRLGTAPTPGGNGSIKKQEVVVNASSSPSTLDVQSGCPQTDLRVPDGPDMFLSCWPGPTSTGYASGITLTDIYGGSDGIYHITANDAVIDHAHIHACTSIEALRVEIRDSYIECTDFSSVIAAIGVNYTIMTSSTYYANIHNTEIYCHDPVVNGNTFGITGAGYTADKVNIHGCQVGVHTGGYGNSTNPQSTIKNSWIHATAGATTGYTSAAIGGQAFNVTAQHNSMVGTTWNHDEWPAGFVWSFDSWITNVTYNVVFNKNLVGGGNLVVQCPNGGSFDPQTPAFTQNRFVKVYGTAAGAAGNWFQCSSLASSHNDNRFIESSNLGILVPSA